MKTAPVWQTDLEAPRFPTLNTDLRVDVLVIGGGITGVTAAFMLKRAGRTVALIERGEIGGGETGHTTAHVTDATDTRLTGLVKTFGRGQAQAACMRDTSRWNKSAPPFDFSRNAGSQAP